MVELTQVGDYKKDVGRILVDSTYAEFLNENEKLVKTTLNKNYGRRQELFNNEKQEFYIPQKQSSYMSKKPQYASQNSLPQTIRKTKNYDEYEDDNDDNSSLAASSLVNSSIVNSSIVNSSLANNFRIGLEVEDESFFSGEIELRGPYSPLECHYYPLINAGHSRRVIVERESINYVTLDEDPLNEATRLMVASSVSINMSGTSICARKTSLMPKLPGLSSICCLLFSPFVEMRTNREGTCYTGALCGLGYDELTHSAIYTENDIECIFDATLSWTDFSQINAVRLAINMVIGSEKEVESWTYVYL